MPHPFIGRDLSQVVHNSRNWKQPKGSPLEDTLYKLQYVEGGSRYTIKWKKIRLENSMYVHCELILI